jgi:hypothetical protein
LQRRVRLPAGRPNGKREPTKLVLLNGPAVAHSSNLLLISDSKTGARPARKGESLLVKTPEPPTLRQQMSAFRRPGTGFQRGGPCKKSPMAIRFALRSWENRQAGPTGLRKLRSRQKLSCSRFRACLRKSPGFGQNFLSEQKAADDEEKSEKPTLSGLGRVRRSASLVCLSTFGVVAMWLRCRLN